MKVPHLFKAGVAATIFGTACFTLPSCTSPPGEQSSVKDHVAGDMRPATEVERSALINLVDWLAQRGLEELPTENVTVPGRNLTSAGFPPCKSTLQELLTLGPKWFRSLNTTIVITGSGATDGGTIGVAPQSVAFSADFVQMALVAPHHTIAALAQEFAHTDDLGTVHAGKIEHPRCQPNNADFTTELRGLKAESAFLKYATRKGDLEPIGSNNLLLHDYNQWKVTNAETLWPLSGQLLGSKPATYFEQQRLLENLYRKPLYVQQLQAFLSRNPPITDASRATILKRLTGEAAALLEELAQYTETFVNNPKKNRFENLVETHMANVWSQKMIIFQQIHKELQQVTVPPNASPIMVDFKTAVEKLATAYANTRANSDLWSQMEHALTHSTSLLDLMNAGDSSASLIKFAAWCGTHQSTGDLEHTAKEIEALSALIAP